MIDVLKSMIKQFMPFAKERMGFESPPRLFLKRDQTNAQNPLGKTAYYDPEQKSVTLYITGRHPKDVMRSLSHELVHHTQNCNGEFDQVGQMGDGYAQNDEHLREMEREAYEKGSLCLRDWEDSIKHTIYFEHLQKGANNMSNKKWKNKELNGLLTEGWGFSMDLSKLSEEKTLGNGKTDGTDSVEAGLDNNKKTTQMDNAAEHGGERGNQNESQEIFAPNHYCVHHGGVKRNGKIEMAEAVSHNYNKRLGRVTHYDMKFSDGVIKENVAFEDIQVTNASLAKEHVHAVGKRDDKEKCPKCNKSPCICDDRPMEEAKLQENIEAVKKEIETFFQNLVEIIEDIRGVAQKYEALVNALMPMIISKEEDRRLLSMLLGIGSEPSKPSAEYEPPRPPPEEPEEPEEAILQENIAAVINEIQTFFQNLIKIIEDITAAAQNNPELVRAVMPMFIDKEEDRRLLYRLLGISSEPSKPSAQYEPPRPPPEEPIGVPPKEPIGVPPSLSEAKLRRAVREALKKSIVKR